MKGQLATQVILRILKTKLTSAKHLYGTPGGPRTFILTF